MEALPDANIKIACLDPEATQVVIPFRKGSDTASLRDNPTTRALLERLPMTVTMCELNGNEKYVYMEESLPANARRPGQIPAGDLMLYGSDCLVLFYESFSSSYSYTTLG